MPRNYYRDPQNRGPGPWEDGRRTWRRRSWRELSKLREENPDRRVSEWAYEKDRGRDGRRIIDRLWAQDEVTEARRNHKRHKRDLYNLRHGLPEVVFLSSEGEVLSCSE